MDYPIINDCPVCHHELHATKLECSHCKTSIENTFSLPKWQLFSKEQLHFIETFIISRGNIKEVEKQLGISYPTVRGKLDQIIFIMTEKKNIKENGSLSKETTDKSEILEKLEKNELTVEEAITLLKKL
ncbi:DUF2089 domain-containing protein [Niallia sp. NCCP-28]|uniref:DUF2089 domain-containing protein n=1 Tax=Niallia sp. NCCP-28 TaxID=2934712 RepID=UPI0020871D0F|nr:DUF2089 domain-containing protein [Niallia sp. NCCP-28]GKU83615.1 hypothetical protein NCCP28_30110 [Niallia sp. NCCP-28]